MLSIMRIAGNTGYSCGLAMIELLWMIDAYKAALVSILSVARHWLAFPFRLFGVVMRCLAVGLVPSHYCGTSCYSRRGYCFLMQKVLNGGVVSVADVVLAGDIGMWGWESLKCPF